MPCPLALGVLLAEMVLLDEQSHADLPRRHRAGVARDGRPRHGRRRARPGGMPATGALAAGHAPPGRVWVGRRGPTPSTSGTGRSSSSSALDNPSAPGTTSHLLTRAVVRARDARARRPDLPLRRDARSGPSASGAWRRACAGASSGLTRRGKRGLGGRRRRPGRRDRGHRRDRSRPERDRQDARRERGGGRRDTDAGALGRRHRTGDGHAASDDDGRPALGDRVGGEGLVHDARRARDRRLRRLDHGRQPAGAALLLPRHPDRREVQPSVVRRARPRSRPAAIGNRRAVILAFGTNAGVDEDAVKQVLDTLGPDRMVVLVNIMAPFARVDTDNAHARARRARPAQRRRRRLGRRHPGTTRTRSSPTASTRRIKGAHLFSKTVRQAMADLSARNTGKTVVLKELPIP